MTLTRFLKLTAATACLSIGIAHSASAATTDTTIEALELTGQAVVVVKPGDSAYLKLTLNNNTDNPFVLYHRVPLLLSSSDTSKATIQLKPPYNGECEGSVQPHKSCTITAVVTDNYNKDEFGYFKVYIAGKFDTKPLPIDVLSGTLMYQVK